MYKLTRGVLVSVEGIDGSGKSTLTRTLAERLSQSLPTLLTKEPGDTPLGQQIRTLVQEKKVAICPKAEYLLFAADRAQHFDQVIIPALKKNILVISDRLADSSLAYQGFGRGLDCTMINTINTWAMNERYPDVTLYIKVSPDVAYERIIKRQEALTSFEQEKKTFMLNVLKGFESIFKERSNVLYISGEQNPEDVLQDAHTQLIQWLITHYFLSTL
ncbi:dTMP kinase [Candidatus Dependentiae bacterium Noda2021]|nr:dTMP kinase [Candidatus Dependentiae bacterium Noda2021]